MQKTTGKKVYGVAGISQKDYVGSAAENGSSGSVSRPLLKVEKENVTVINGEFSLPDIRETKENSVQFAVRVLGILVTKDLMGHLPGNVTGENIGQLVPFYPFSYHKRFGKTWTDRVCPASTRTGKCPVCKGRMELFGSAQYKSGVLSKKDIMGAGFGTRQVALVIGRFFYNDEDLGIRAWWTPLTNEEIATARRDKFFDKIAELMTPKKLSAVEKLPEDYYSNGSGARWLIVDYGRELFDESTVADKSGDGNHKKRAPAPFWQLKSVTCVKEIEGLGKAEDIWWPEIDGDDSIETVDIYDLINHTPPEELDEAVNEQMQDLLSPKAHRQATKKAEGEPASAEWDGPAPTWGELHDMDAEELVRVGTAFGGDGESLALIGQANEDKLRRSVAKLCGAKPEAVRYQETPATETVDDDPTPF